MKKIIFFIVLILFAPLCVMAEEHHVYSIDMNVFIDENGTAHVTELWEIKANTSKEWCKIFSNLENVDLEDVSVLMDEDLYGTSEDGEKDSNKKANYKLTYVTGGIKFCFGYNDNKRHNFMLEYEIKDYVLDTEDSQVLYHVLTENVSADRFYADIVMYYNLPDDFKLETPGFSGEAFVSEGRIIVKDTDGLNDQYVTVLAKFPLETFASAGKREEFNSYDDALTHSEKGKYKYSDEIRGVNRFTFIDFIFVLLSVFVFILILEFIVRNVTGKSMLKHEKVKKILIVIKKIFQKMLNMLKKLFSNVKVLFKKIFKIIKNKINKK